MVTTNLNTRVFLLSMKSMILEGTLQQSDESNYSKYIQKIK